MLRFIYARSDQDLKAKQTIKVYRSIADCSLYALLSLHCCLLLLGGPDQYARLNLRHSVLMESSRGKSRKSYLDTVMLDITAAFSC